MGGSTDTGMRGGH